MPDEQLVDDFRLLNLIIKDGKAAPLIYRPGRYWENATRSSINELLRYGISDFRGSTCGAAAGLSDYLQVDRRHTSNYGVRRFVNAALDYAFPLNRIYNSQVSLTATYVNELIRFQRAYLQCDSRVSELLENYQIDFETTRGGDNAWLEYGGRRYSFHYLEVLSTLDYVSKDVPLSTSTRYLEIGGGFGANVHLLIELFGVRKIIYLDIAPNLYIGTQYLKSFYGSAVNDYARNRTRPIAFRDDSELEIICLLPAQIEQIESQLDVFHNSHSFVEMSEPAVQNYAKFVGRLLRNRDAFVSLVTYDGFDLQTTIHPNQVLKYFSGTKSEKVFDRLMPQRSNLHVTIRC